MFQAYILAAGKGTRMKSNLPKVLHPIAGKPMVMHVIDACKVLSPSQITLVVGHGAEHVRARLGDQTLEYVEQETQKGTGHAVQMGLSGFSPEQTVLILYGDVPLIATETLSEMLNLVDANSMGLLTVVLDDPTGYGRIVRDEQGAVTQIVEHKDADATTLAIQEVNTGIMAVKGAHLLKWLPCLNNNNAQGEYYLTDIIAMAHAEGVTINSCHPGAVFEVMGVNDHQQQALLERIAQSQIAKTLMAEGLTLMDPARFDCRGQLSVGRDCVVDVNCIFEGQVTLGDGVVVGANCIIKNSVIESGAILSPNSIVENATVGPNCQVGPYARLRPGSVMHSNAKVGNFVEVKKSTIGQGSKVNHLSYIGDAVLGDNVNIGAGTITCNYDGVNKHQTHIANHVFVGSNSALVAPVSIGTSATIAAGSTVTGDVKDHQLAVARMRQKNLDGWQRPSKK